MSYSRTNAEKVICKEAAEKQYSWGRNGDTWNVAILCHNTERPETITIGTNELIGTDPSKLPPALERLMAGQWKKGAIPPKWDGKAAERIVEQLERLLLAGC
jgi:UDP-N-acetylglucosamine 2-epimerase